MEVLPLRPLGGVGEGLSSDLPPSEPIVEDRPRNPMRLGGCGEERAERADLEESLRYSEPRPGEPKFSEFAARATCDAEGSGGVCVPFSPSVNRRAVRGGLPVGEPGEPVLMPPVEARGVAGAVSGNCGGSIFMGRGKREARCFRRPKPKRVEPRRWGWAGRVLASNET